MKNKIIIFSMGRSGGNLLEGILLNDKKTKSFGEYFNRYKVTNTETEVPNLIDDYVYKAESYFNEYNTLLFRIHRTQLLHPIYGNIELKYFNKWKKILLYREDFLSNQVSLAISIFHKKWIFTEENKIDIPRYDKIKIFLNKKYINNNYINMCSYYKSIINQWGDDVSIIKYEDLLQKKYECLNKVVSDNELDIDFSNIFVKTIKVGNIDDNKKIILNIDEFPFNEYTLAPPFNYSDKL